MFRTLASGIQPRVALDDRSVQADHRVMRKMGAALIRLFIISVGPGPFRLRMVKLRLRLNDPQPRVATY